MSRRTPRPGGRPAPIPGAHRLGEGQARRVALRTDAGEVEIVLCRVDGELHALDSLCPHEGGRIADGPLEEGGLAICPLHRIRFDPTSGAAVDDACPPARTYPVRETETGAEVWL